MAEKQYTAKELKEVVKEMSPSEKVRFARELGIDLDDDEVLEEAMNMSRNNPANVQKEESLIDNVFHYGKLALAAYGGYKVITGVANHFSNNSGVPVTYNDLRDTGSVIKDLLNF